MRHLLLALLLLFPFSAMATGEFGLGGGTGLVYSGKFSRSSDGIYLDDVTDDFWIGATTCGTSPFCFDTSLQTLYIGTAANGGSIVVRAYSEASNPGLNVVGLSGNANYPAAPTGNTVKLFTMQNGEIYKRDSADSYPVLVPTEKCETWRIDGQGAETDAWWSPSDVPRKFFVHTASSTHMETFRSVVCYASGSSATVTVGIRTCTSFGCGGNTVLVTAGAACSNISTGSTLTLANDTIGAASKYTELQVTVPNGSGTVQEVSIHACFDRY